MRQRTSWRGWLAVAAAAAAAGSGPVPAAAHGEGPPPGAFAGFAGNFDDVSDALAKVQALKVKQFQKAAAVFVEAASISDPRTEEDRATRRSGLCGLARLAQHEENRRAMWQDRWGARAALIKGALLPPEEKKRPLPKGKLAVAAWAAKTLSKPCHLSKEDLNASACALQAFMHLANNSQNRGAIFVTIASHHAIVSRAQPTNSNAKARQYALATLGNLALDKVVSRLIWLDLMGARAALVHGALLKAPEGFPQVRGNAFMGLANLAKSAGNAISALMWSNPGVKLAVTGAVAQGDPYVKAAGLGAVAGLAVNPMNAANMWWAHQRMYRLILAAASPEECSNSSAPSLLGPPGGPPPWPPPAPGEAADAGGELLQSALAALVSLADAWTIRKAMWEDPETSGLFLCWGQNRGLLPGRCPNCQARGVEGLKNLAGCDAIRVDMFRNRAGPLFTDIIARSSTAIPVDDSNVTFFAFNGFWELAGSSAAKGIMWDDNNLQVMLRDAANPSGDRDAQIRGVALGTLWRLSTDPTVARIMWNDAGSGGWREFVREAASELTGWSEALGRQFAMAILFEMADKEVGLATEMLVDEATMRAIIGGALTTDAAESEVQAYALFTLRHFAAGEDSRVLLWGDTDVNGARQALLMVASRVSDEQATARGIAMCTLQLLTAAPDNQESMWRNLEARRIFIDGARAVGNPDCRKCALAALVYLATNGLINAEMWQDLPTRTLLLETAAQPGLLFGPLRKLAVAALENLAKQAANQQPMWFSSASNILVSLANPSIFQLLSPADHETRARALAALGNLALDHTVGKRIWRDKFGALRVILAAATSCKAAEVRARTYGLSALARLAEGHFLRFQMWFNMDVQRAVLKASWPHGRLFENSRAAAMATLWQFSFDPIIQGLMWVNPVTRTTLLKAAWHSEPNVKARHYALATLGNLAQSKVNQPLMWSYLGLKTTLVAAVQEAEPDLEVRAWAMVALQILALSKFNAAQMWWNRWLVHAVNTAAQFPSEVPPDDVRGVTRNYALAILQLLSKAPGNKKSMYKAEVKQALYAACTSHWSQLGEGTKGRTYALTTYANLATCEANSVLMWNHDPDVMLCLSMNSGLPLDVPTSSTAQWISLGVASSQAATWFSQALLDHTGGADTVKVAGEATALAAIANMAAAQENKQSMWNAWVQVGTTNPVQRRAVNNLVTAAGAENPRYSAFRVIGLKGLRCLAEEPANMELMWTQVGIAFLAAAHLRGHGLISAEEAKQWGNAAMNSSILEQGLCGLAVLARSPAVQGGMWNTALARMVLLNGATLEAENSADVAAQECAMEALANLALLPANQVDMWGARDMREAILYRAQCKDPRLQKARTYAMNALSNLAEANENGLPMWAGDPPEAGTQRVRGRRMRGFSPWASNEGGRELT